mgnify:CR=1 FL=1
MYRRMELDTKLLLAALLTILICYGSIATMKLLIIPFLSTAGRSYFFPWILALPQVFLVVLCQHCVFGTELSGIRIWDFKHPALGIPIFWHFCV